MEVFARQGGLPDLVVHLSKEYMNFFSVTWHTWY
jgi:hypothetical protein